MIRYRALGGIAIFIVRKPESSNKTIRMPNEMIERLEKIAADNDISFNQLVIQCCDYALKDVAEKFDES
jgi:predicted HicB family RNase H-like nuclease